MYISLYYNDIPVHTYIVHTNKTSYGYILNTWVISSFLSHEVLYQSPLAVSADDARNEWHVHLSFCGHEQQKTNSENSWKHCQTPLFHPLFDTHSGFPLALLHLSFCFKLEMEFHHPPEYLISTDVFGPSEPNSRILAFSWDKSKRNLQIPNNQRHTDFVG